MKKNIIIKNYFPPTASVFFVLILWQFSVIIFNVESWFLPSPSNILIELINSYEILLENSLVTLSEITIGLIISILISIMISGMIFWFKSFEKTIYPLLITSQIIPVFTLAPILIVWFGTGLFSKIIIIVLFTFFPLVINLVTAIKNVDMDMIRMFNSLGCTKFQMFRKLYIPAILPNFLSGCKVACVISVIGAVIGEWIGSSNGLGWVMKISGPQFQTARVFASIVCLSFIALVLFFTVVMLEKKILRRYPN
tara:strand:- start:360 stop:1118 length:759 start_codon:yes stop_codon:yes gene_type:complete